MPIALTYRAAMQRLAELAGPEHPAHVQVKAVSKIASELSPNNPRHAEVMRALDPDYPVAAEQTAWIHYAETAPAGEHFYACYDTDEDLDSDEEAAGPEEDDPL